MNSRSHADRRGGDRRRNRTELGERGMRCGACGARWYSAIAGLTTQWAQCATCGGPLHAERRTGADRRAQARRIAA